MRGLLGLLSFLLWVSKDVRHSRLTLGVVAIAGGVGGIAGAGMMALITRALTPAGARAVALPWVFAGLCLILPTVRFVSQLLLLTLTQKSLLSLRLRLTRAILGAPLRHLEELGPHRLVAMLVNDINSIVDSIAVLPTLTMQSCLLASCLAYLGWLSWHVLLEVGCFIVLGVVTYQLPVLRALTHLRRAREHYDELVGQIHALTQGTKELKMHRRRRREFLREVEGSAAEYLRENRVGVLVFVGAASWGQTLVYAVLGLLVFVLPRYQPVEQRTLLGFAVILFQIMTPLEILMNALPQFGRAAVSARAVEQLGLSLETESRERETAGEDAAGPDWGRLELRGVTHAYRRENVDESFLMGPIDLAFSPGELVFLVGGNGSGKTTLAKLLVGLYAPESGEIHFAGEEVNDGNRERYRESFSVVFADFFLFEKLLGLDPGALDEEARRYLSRLHLDGKVQVRDGILSTVDLSQGQRKRLALMTAYLEDRPIYLFDEWAADQDPVFKEIFYLTLLPELKARGKTVFVISHDDAYFHVADRIVKLDYGRLESDLSAAQAMAPVIL